MLLMNFFFISNLGATEEVTSIILPVVQEILHAAHQLPKEELVEFQNSLESIVSQGRAQVYRATGGAKSSSRYTPPPSSSSYHSSTNNETPPPTTTRPLSPRTRSKRSHPDESGLVRRAKRTHSDVEKDILKTRKIDFSNIKEQTNKEVVVERLAHHFEDCRSLHFSFSMALNH